MSAAPAALSLRPRVACEGCGGDVERCESGPVEYRSTWYVALHDSASHEGAAVQGKHVGCSLCGCGPAAPKQERIVSTPGALGGAPRFAGTRISVAAIQTFLSRGYDVATILRMYPALSAEDIAAARTYPQRPAAPGGEVL